MVSVQILLGPLWVWQVTPIEQISAVFLVFFCFSFFAMLTTQPEAMPTHRSEFLSRLTFALFKGICGRSMDRRFCFLLKREMLMQKLCKWEDKWTASQRPCQYMLFDVQASERAAITLQFDWPKALSPVTMVAEQKGRLDLTVKCKWVLFLPLLTGLWPFSFLW